MDLSNMMSGWGGWASWTMYLGMIVFWVGVVALVIWGVKALGGPTAAQSVPLASHVPQESAADVLKRRYASGEIDSAEFQKKRLELM